MTMITRIEFKHDEVLQLIVDHIYDRYDVHVAPSQLKVRVTQGYSGELGGPSVPSRIEMISFEEVVD